MYEVIFPSEAPKMEQKSSPLSQKKKKSLTKPLVIEGKKVSKWHVTFLGYFLLNAAKGS